MGSDQPDVALVGALTTSYQPPTPPRKPLQHPSTPAMAHVSLGKLGGTSPGWVLSEAVLGQYLAVARVAIRPILFSCTSIDTGMRTQRCGTWKLCGVGVAKRSRAEQSLERLHRRTTHVSRCSSTGI